MFLNHFNWRIPPPFCLTWLFFIRTTTKTIYKNRCGLNNNYFFTQTRLIATSIEKQNKTKQKTWRMSKMQETCKYFFFHSITKINFQKQEREKQSTFLHLQLTRLSIFSCSTCRSYFFFNLSPIRKWFVSGVSILEIDLSCYESHRGSNRD